MSDSSVHVVVLSKDRPATLLRCLSQVDLEPGDRLTVIDDSQPEAFAQGQRALRQSAAPGAMAHLSASRIFETLEESLPEEALLWTHRVAPRDIAPLRNLSLLLSTLGPRRFTLLIDDDMDELDIPRTKAEFQAIIEEKGAAIAGAHLAGTNEEDIVERLTWALGQLEANRAKRVPSREVKELFRVQAAKPAAHRFARADCVSGGYLVFSIPVASLFSFPPGYNEDWLWCLEMNRRGVAEVLRTAQVVRHDPPEIRQMTSTDVRFELLGDLVLDLYALNETWDRDVPTNGGAFAPIGASFLISDDMDPTTRVKDLIQASRSCGGAQMLQDLGLGLLEKMHCDGRLALDWHSEVLRWRADADRKERSFALMLQAYRSEFRDLVFKKESER